MSEPVNQPSGPLISEPVLLRTKANLAAARPGLPAPVVLVPTMGALHHGHRALLRAARAAAGPSGSVLVSIFVNPLQFRPGEDLDRYPRTLDDDLAMCAQEEVRAVFAPSAAEMYPGGPPQVTVDPGPAGQVFEGEFRPGFFGGVLTVVLKLFHLVRPDVAVFGEKDYQQLVLVQKMVRDLECFVSIVGVPIVREPDGLALSSRNVYLSADDRAGALVLQRALRAGAGVSAHGPDAVLEAARAVLDKESGVAVDYLELRAPDLTPAPASGQARLLVAARVGPTRLIDNVAVRL
jgi:pantoate--beta-alanine ligase